MCRVVWPKVLHRRPPQVSPQQLLVVVVLLGIQVDLPGGFHIPFCQGPNKDSLLLLFPSVKRGRRRHRRPGQPHRRRPVLEVVGIVVIQSFLKIGNLNKILLI